MATETLASLPDIASRREVAAYLGVALSTIAKWAMEGKGPRYVRAGGRVLYRREDVLAWVASLEPGFDHR